MSTSNDLSTFQGYFTTKYASKVVDAVKIKSHFARTCPFEAAARIGDFYQVPVALTLEHGVVYNADGSVASTADPGAWAAETRPAQVQGSEIYINSQISMKAISSANGGEVKYGPTAAFMVKRMAMSMAHVLELNCIYGQTGIAETTEITASGTTGTFTVSAGTFAPGAWLGAEGKALDLFATVGAAAPINATALIRVTSVDIPTRVVSFSCNSSDAAALDAATTSFVFARRANAGSNSFREAAGLNKVVTNTGTIYNISASNFSLWRSQVVDAAGAALSLQHIVDLMAKLSDAGLSGEKLNILVNPKPWGRMMLDQAALREYKLEDISRNKYENGAEGLLFRGQTGEVELISHPYVFPREAFAYVPSVCMRVGSSDVTFNMPGVEGPLMVMLESSTGFLYRGYSDQAWFTDHPAWLGKISNLAA